MKRYLLIVLLSVMVGGVAARAQTPAKLDIAIVLDNSGSMKRNDPEFLTKQVVSNFLNGLTADARIGIVIFAEKAELALPLTEIGAQDTKEKVQASLNRVNYTGQLTNSPAAIERALYELKQNGRKDAERIIIFMTDGIIDTGDKQKDREGERWLREDLAQDCQGSGVRIFGIAFTEEADYKLIQALSQKTGGDYYRALRAEDIQGVFQSIREAISKPRPKPEPSASSPVPVETTGSRMGLVVVAIVGLIVFGVVAVIFMTRRKKGDAAASLISADIEDSTIPDAVLIGMGPSGPVTHKITKRVMKIGRMEKEKVAGKPALDIELNDKGVPAFHSTIEYRDQSFYLVDQRSTNGTFLNGQRITSEVRLKGGDEIAFDRCKFRFVLPEMAARGGTVLSPPPAGGTVLRAPGSPLVPAPQQEEIPPPVSREEEEGTRVKTAMCPNHPSFRATELCPVCKKGYCKDCMVEKDGKPICKECAK